MDSGLLPEVRDFQLTTKFLPNGTQHEYCVSDLAEGQRGARAKELWQRRKNIGHGGYGRVWLEECVSGRSQGQLRAVKEVAKRGSTHSTLAYCRELAAITKFSREKYVDCFVKSYGWYESESAILIAMEYFEHGDLSNFLGKRLPEEEAKTIAEQLVEGIAFLHDNNFAHRDLKPANILVRRPGSEWWVKIGDLGISKRAEPGVDSLRTYVGTPGFVAPELDGLHPPGDDVNPETEAASYTVAVDFWSLGEIVYQMLAAKPAFSGPRDLQNYVGGRSTFSQLVILPSDVSADCKDFVERALAPSARLRLTAKSASEHNWIRGCRLSSTSRPTTPTDQGALSLADPVSGTRCTISGPTARWTTVTSSLAIPRLHSQGASDVLQQPPRTTSFISDRAQTNKISVDPFNQSYFPPERLWPLVKDCTERLEDLDAGFAQLMPFQGQSEPLLVREVVDEYFLGNSGVVSNTSFQADVILGILRWCWSRLPNGIVGWKLYRRIKDLDLENPKDSNMNLHDILQSVLKPTESDRARVEIILSFFYTITTIANSNVNHEITGDACYRVAAWWAFDLRGAGKGMEGLYQSWAKCPSAALATQVLFGVLRKAEERCDLPVFLDLGYDGRVPSVVPPIAPQYRHVVIVNLVVSQASASPLEMMQRYEGATWDKEGDPSTGPDDWTLPFLPDSLQAELGIAGFLGLSNECVAIIESITETYDSGYFKSPFAKRRRTTLEMSNPQTRASIRNFMPDRMDNTFWWVWICSLATEEPSARQNNRGSMLLAVLVYGTQKIYVWIEEEAVRGMPSTLSVSYSNDGVHFSQVPSSDSNS